MTIANRLAELSSLGIKLWQENDQLRCSAPKGVLTTEIKAELKANKAEILNLINSTKNSVDVFRDTSIPAAPVAENYRISPQQRRYIADFTWDPDRTWYTVIFQSPFPVICETELLEKAFRIICDRHESLRTVYPLINGERRLLIKQESSISFVHEQHDCLDKDRLDERLGELRSQANHTKWDVSNGPLGKMVLITDLQGDLNTVLLFFHRVVMDGASIRLLILEYMKVTKELSSGSVTGNYEPVVNYRDFSEWLHGLEEEGHFLSSRDYWRAELSSPLPDPFGFNSHGAPGTIPKDAGFAIKKISDSIVQQMRIIAADNGWLFPMTLFAVYVISLWNAGSGDDIVMDTSLIGRNRPELRNSLGFFTNAAAIRVSVRSDQVFSDLVSQLTHKFVKAEENQYFQYDSIIDDLGIDREKMLFPLSGILFNTLNVNIPHAQDLGDQLVWQTVSSETRYGIMFYVMCHPECISLELKHRLALMDKETAITIVETYEKVFTNLAHSKLDLSIKELLSG